MDQHTTTQTDTEKVSVPKVEFNPLPRSVHERPHGMWIRVYDVCTDHGAHTDPDLQHWGYAEGGI